MSNAVLPLGSRTPPGCDFGIDAYQGWLATLAPLSTLHSRLRREENPQPGGLQGL